MQRNSFYLLSRGHIKCYYSTQVVEATGLPVVPLATNLFIYLFFSLAYFLTEASALPPPPPSAVNLVM